MKVGMCTRYIDTDFTGMGLYVTRLLEGMMAFDEPPDLHLMHMRDGDNPLYARAAGEHIYSTPTRVMWWRSQDKFCRRLSRAMDVVHEPFIGLSSKMSCPQVLSFHDAFPLTHPEHNTLRFHQYFKRVMPRVVSNADAIICNSEATKGDLLELYPAHPDRVAVVYNGVDRVDPDIRGTYDAMKPYVLALSNTTMKNVGFTVREFLGYKEARGGDLSLVVVGTDFSGLSEGHRDVVVTGYLERERLMELMAGAEALLFPSLHEGFGYPPLEAMALGVPTVVSDRGSLPEVTGDASLVVDIDRPGSLAGAIHRIMTEEDLVRDLRERGMAQQQRYSWERCVKETYQVYEGLMR